jgi:5-methyltetrahydrofolate--homocysteine methyltransferase
MTPLQEYIDAAKEYKADAIGMSALLVQTSNHMITVSKMMASRGSKSPCLSAARR